MMSPAGKRTSIPRLALSLLTLAMAAPVFAAPAPDAPSPAPDPAAAHGPASSTAPTQAVLTPALANSQRDPATPPAPAPSSSAHTPAQPTASSPAAVAHAGAAAISLPHPRASVAPPNACPGEYADNLSALAPKVRRLEAQLASYTFCIRTTATYECPSYGVDGELIHKRTQVVAHGTGFAYRRGGSGTLLLTNQHVAQWPIVTDDDHPAEDVPAGCKRVGEELSIVENEADSYERDDIPLSLVVADPQTDIAVLTTSSKLAVLPWKIGHSSRLRDRNIVDVRGFPLGVFKATNVGKVVSAYDHDTYKDWDHDDFVVDALLSQGNSGSPVLAISCKTGEFELVGVYHAGYTRASALNAVIGIDQIRNLITTLKLAPRLRDPATALDSTSRARLATASLGTLEPYFPLGSLTASVRARADGSFFFELLNKNFPLRTYPILVLEDLPTTSDDDFGALGRIWFGNREGLKVYDLSDLDVPSRPQLQKLLDGLRRASLAAFALRESDQNANASRERFEQTERLERALRRTSSSQRDLAQAAMELSDRLAPRPDETTVSLEAILAEPPAESAEASNSSAEPPVAGEEIPSLGAGSPNEVPEPRP